MPTAQFFANLTPSSDERTLFQHIINGVADGDLRAVRQLLKKVNSAGRSTWHCGLPGAVGVQSWPPSPLHRAVETEQLNALDLLVEHGFSPNATLMDRKEGKKVTPLHWAVYKGKEKSVRHLLKIGADTRVLGSWNNYKGTPKDFARTKSMREIFTQHEARRAPRPQPLTPTRAPPPAPPTLEQAILSQKGPEQNLINQNPPIKNTQNPQITTNSQIYHNQNYVNGVFGFGGLTQPSKDPEWTVVGPSPPIRHNFSLQPPPRPIQPPKRQEKPSEPMGRYVPPMLRNNNRKSYHNCNQSFPGSQDEDRLFVSPPPGFTPLSTDGSSRSSSPLDSGISSSPPEQLNLAQAMAPSGDHLENENDDDGEDTMEAMLESMWRKVNTILDEKKAEVAQAMSISRKIDEHAKEILRLQSMKGYRGEDKVRTLEKEITVLEGKRTKFRNLMDFEDDEVKVFEVKVKTEAKKKLEEEVECCICLEVPRSQIYSCQSCENLMCINDLIKLQLKDVQKCPTCNENFEVTKPKRNRTVERIVEKLF